MIAKLDRLSRDAHFLTGLHKAGVKFVAVDMPEANEMVVTIMAAVAQAGDIAKWLELTDYEEATAPTPRGPRRGPRRLGHDVTEPEAEPETESEPEPEPEPEPA